MSRAAMDRAYRAFESAGLRPIIDVPLARVLADCPSCMAGDALYRPLVVSCHGAVRMACSFGCSDTAVREALASESVDWRTLCHELLNIAQGLRAALETATAKTQSFPVRMAA